MKQEEYNSALEWFQKSLDIAKSNDDKPAQTAIQKAMDDANKRITKNMKESGRTEGKCGTFCLVLSVITEGVIASNCVSYENLQLVLMLHKV